MIDCALCNKLLYFCEIYLCIKTYFRKKINDKTEFFVIIVFFVLYVRLYSALVKFTLLVRLNSKG